MRSTELMGPPAHGPWVQVQGPGFIVAIQVEGDDDREIVMAAMELGERRRYGRVATSKSN